MSELEQVLQHVENEIQQDKLTETVEAAVAPPPLQDSDHEGAGLAKPKKKRAAKGDIPAPPEFKKMRVSYTMKQKQAAVKFLTESGFESLNEGVKVFKKNVMNINSNTLRHWCHNADKIMAVKGPKDLRKKSTGRSGRTRDVEFENIVLQFLNQYKSERKVCTAMLVFDHLNACHPHYLVDHENKNKDGRTTLLQKIRRVAQRNKYKLAKS